MMNPDSVLPDTAITRRLLKTLGVVILIAWGGSRSLSVGAASGDADLTPRGAYLVTGFGCADCHTPMKMGPNGPEPDRSRALSGHPEPIQLSPPPKGMPPGPGSAPPPIPLSPVLGGSVTLPI